MKFYPSPFESEGSVVCLHHVLLGQWPDWSVYAREREREQLCGGSDDKGHTRSQTHTHTLTLTHTETHTCTYTDVDVRL